MSRKELEERATTNSGCGYDKFRVRYDKFRVWLRQIQGLMTEPVLGASREREFQSRNYTSEQGLSEIPFALSTQVAQRRRTGAT